MAHITTSKRLTVNSGRHSFTATPEMGVIKHFPSAVCAALVEKGAEYVSKKSSKEAKADPAK